MRGQALALAGALLWALAWPCAGAPKAGHGAANTFSFGVISHSFQSGPDETELKRAIRETEQANLAFVVATGIKGGAEACSDKLYAQRKSVLNQSRRPMIVALAASDWCECKNSMGRPVAIERLSRLRDVFFGDTMSLGERKIELTRLSSNATFRSYAENAHWEYGRVLFATINLPADNNRFRPEAGRNGEFEDRLVANRAWLKRLFGMAQRRKLDGLVLFSDGDVGVMREESGSLFSPQKHDGFAEIRHQIRALAKKFPGKILLVDAQDGAKPAAQAIAWRDNLAHVSVSSNWAEIGVDARSAPLFTLKGTQGERHGR